MGAQFWQKLFNKETPALTTLKVQLHVLFYVSIMSHTGFRVNLHPIIAWISRNLLLETGVISEVTATGCEPATTEFKNENFGQMVACLLTN